VWWSSQPRCAAMARISRTDSSLATGAKIKKIQKFRNRKYNFILNGPIVPIRVTNRDQRSSSRSTCPGPRGGPLVPVRKQLGLKCGAFSPALLVPVAETGINGLYKPGLKAFFPPVIHLCLNKNRITYFETKILLLQYTRRQQNRIILALVRDFRQQ
jgi:hypothetical protein